MTVAALTIDPVAPARRPSKWCDCGRPKELSAEGCDRCVYLDGRTPFQGAVIGALRGTDGLTLRELTEAIHGQSTESLRCSMLRVVQVLEAASRIRRYWFEGEEPVPHLAFGKYSISRAIGGWKYALAGRDPFPVKRKDASS